MPQIFVETVKRFLMEIHDFIMFIIIDQFYDKWGGWWVAYRILVSAPVPFGFNWGWNWVGTGLGSGLGGLGTRGTRVWD